MAPNKPLNLKVLDGGASHNAKPKPATVGQKTAIQKLKRPPRILDKEGKKFWREIVPQVADLGLLHTVDRAGLILLCEAYSDLQQARADLTDHTMTLDKDGVPVRRHPAQVAKENAAHQFRRLVDDYGLTPKSRLKLGVLDQGGSSDDKFDALLQ